MVIKSLAELLLATLELRAGSMLTLAEIMALTRWFTRHSRTEDYWIVYQQVQRVTGLGPWALEPKVVAAARLWWWAVCFTKAGLWRDTVFTRQLTAATKRAIDQLDHAQFMLVDWYWDDRRWVPIVRVTTKDGPGFDYLWRGWQSGGNHVVAAWFYRDNV